MGFDEALDLVCKLLNIVWRLLVLRPMVWPWARGIGRALVRSLRAMGAVGRSAVNRVVAWRGLLYAPMLAWVVGGVSAFVVTGGMDGAAPLWADVWYFSVLSALVAWVAWQAAWACRWAGRKGWRTM